MSTLFPSSELDKKLSEATSNEAPMPPSGLLYELGRATHRDEDYRISAQHGRSKHPHRGACALHRSSSCVFAPPLRTVTAAIWQTVLRSNQRPRVVLKTLCVLEAYAPRELQLSNRRLHDCTLLAPPL